MAQLKALVKDLPEQNEYGEDYEIWIETDEGLSSVVVEASSLNQGDLILSAK